MKRRYETTLAPHEVADRITAEIDSVGAGYYLIPSRQGREFVGRVSATDFYVHVRHGGRASFAPRLIGRIAPSGAGSTVVVDTRVDPLVRTLVLAVLVMAALIAAVPYLLSGRNPIIETAGVMAGGTLLIYVVSLPRSRREARRLQEFVERVLSSRGEPR